MKYLLRFHPAVRKDLRNVDPKARSIIISTTLPNFIADPFQGTPLSGPLRGYWKHRVFVLSVWYRIAYEIDIKLREVVIIAIGPRGGFYQHLRHRTKK